MRLSLTWLKRYAGLYMDSSVFICGSEGGPNDVIQTKYQFDAQYNKADSQKPCQAPADDAAKKIAYPCESMPRIEAMNPQRAEEKS